MVSAGCSNKTEVSTWAFSVMDAHMVEVHSSFIMGTSTRASSTTIKLRHQLASRDTTNHNT